MTAVEPEVRVIRHIAELCSVSAPWAELHRVAGRNSVFKSVEFVELWFRCFAAPDDIRVLTVWRRGRLIGVVPLVMVRRNGLRVLHSLTNDHCLHSDPLVLDGEEAAVQESLLAALAADELCWDLLQYSFSYSFSRVPELIPRHLLQARRAAWRDAVQPTYVVRLNKPFEQYVRNDISDNLRKSLARHRNRMLRLGVMTLERLGGADGRESWEEFVDIEDSGWKGRAGSSLRRVDERYAEFYRGLVRLLAAAGALQMYFLRLEGRRLAGAFCYGDGDVLHWFKTGYREEFAHLSPGNLLLIQIVEDLLKQEGRYALLHMFPWEHGYKHRFANESAACVEKTIYNATGRGRLTRFVDRVRGAARRAVRRRLAPRLIVGRSGLPPVEAAGFALVPCGGECWGGRPCAR